jgi:hypothetical protein
VVALRERIKIFHRKTPPRDAAFDLREVAGKSWPNISGVAFWTLHRRPAQRSLCRSRDVR